MQCPACEHDNPKDATVCAGCGKALPRRPRRRGSAEDAESPADPEAERRNAAALRAYRLCILGLVPGIGLVLGPVAVILGILARTRGQGVSGFTAQGPATVAVFFGILITATQWAGVTLMVIGWGAKP
jgi:hypothetical protein